MTQPLDALRSAKARTHGGSVHERGEYQRLAVQYADAQLDRTEPTVEAIEALLDRLTDGSHVILQPQQVTRMIEAAKAKGGS